jgi:hypothetical protein
MCQRDFTRTVVGAASGANIHKHNQLYAPIDRRPAEHVNRLNVSAGSQESDCGVEVLRNPVNVYAGKTCLKQACVKVNMSKASVCQGRIAEFTSLHI